MLGTSRDENGRILVEFYQNAQKVKAKRDDLQRDVSFQNNVSSLPHARKTSQGLEPLRYTNASYHEFDQELPDNLDIPIPRQLPPLTGPIHRDSSHSSASIPSPTPLLDGRSPFSNHETGHTSHGNDAKISSQSSAAGVNQKELKRPPASHVPANQSSTQAKPEEVVASGKSLPKPADKTPAGSEKKWKKVSVMASSRTLVSKGASVGEEDAGKWLPVSENAQKYMNRMETFKAKTAIKPGDTAEVLQNSPPLYGASFAAIVEAATKKSTKIERLKTFLAAPQQRPEAAKLYDPKNTLTNLFTWSGTALQLVFYKPDFWFCLTLHVVLTVVAHVILDVDWDPENEVPNGRATWPKIKDDTMLVMGGILVFFMVFFNGQAYSRFFSQYFLIRKIGYNVQDLFFLTRTHIESPIKQLAIVRRLHAAHYLGFAYMPQNYELPGFVAATYVHLQKIHLLLPSEASDLHASEDTVSVHEECLLWLIQVLRKEMAEGNLKPPIYRAFEAKTHAINDEFEELKAYALQPIPFAYYHLMTVLCTCYLVVLAYTSVWVTAYYSIFGYLGSLLALLGLREAAACLSDPLGTDQSDIPVFDMVAEQHFRNVRILTTRPHRWNNLEPVPYFGSKMSLLAIADALQPADFQDIAKAPVLESEVEPSRLTGEAADFWNTLAKGRISKDAQLELQKLNTAEEPPAADDDDDDDDENFEVDDF